MDLSLYRELFVHRTDVFAQQLESGAYMPIRRELTDDDIAEHLAGLWSIGTYVIDPSGEEQTVKYICFDLDTHDPVTTEDLLEVVEGFVEDTCSDQYATRCLMRESSGNKGTHVWLFLDQPLSAARVRRWLEAEFWPEWNALTGSATLEVFPKQDTVMIGGFGNLVKLPLGVHAVSGKKSEIVPQLGWATRIDEVVPFPSELVPDTAPVETATRYGQRPTTGEPTSPFPCIDQIIHSGAGKGQRNAAMFHLALYCFGHAIPSDLAEELCSRANQEFDPPLGDSEVTKTVQQAYTGRYHSANCGTDWLKSYCEGPCRGGWAVAAKEPEGGSLRKANEGQAVEVQVVRKTTDGGRTRLTIGHPDATNQPTLVCG